MSVTCTSTKQTDKQEAEGVLNTPLKRFFFSNFDEDQLANMH